tara:strand:- start:1330 stop:2370 length:1041 start_codon:yes stop_codon:yes gene_type:complete
MRTILFFLIGLLSFSQEKLPMIYAYGGQHYSDWQDMFDDLRDEDNDGVINEMPCVQGGTEVVDASSTLKAQPPNDYYLKNISDFNHKTAWVEGKSDYGIGEYFIVTSDFGFNYIENGYQKSSKSWRNNSRVKTFKVYKNGTPICFLRLKDLMGGQRFDLPVEMFDNAYFKFEIVDVYKGERWNDVAITHLDYQGCCLLKESAVLDVDGVIQEISSIKEGDILQTINLNSGKVETTEVKKVVKLTHHKILEIKTQNRNIKATADHPFYIKGFGFTSLKKILKYKKSKQYQDLINKIEILVWDKEEQKTKYQLINNINIIEGVFETYTILDLSHGNNFIANGFVTSPY